MKITIGISARHMHITKEDYDLLFDEPINKIKDLNQPGEFASDKTVTIKNNNNIIENVRIVGPFRKYTQVELSQSDAYKLKLELPIRQSGDIKDAAKITIFTPKGEIERKAAIITTRHIHITKEEREKYNLTQDNYAVKVKGEKGGILSNVTITERDKSYFEMHIDIDDANAFNLKNNDEVEIVKIMEK